MSHRPHRAGVVTLLVLLFGITYLDRVAISVAGPRMQQDLGIDPVAWGWVTGVFTLAYAVFEIPTGAMGDRLGARVVLTRIVAWWSAFTAFTGMVSSLGPLLAVRFLFGAGEAGAFPNASIVVARWFPAARRATVSGVNLMAGQLGGALAPFVVLPIQQRWGWRTAFFVLGAMGVVWAAVWYGWYRDDPPEGEAETAGVSRSRHHAAFPWREAFRSGTVWALMGLAFCYIYVYTFFQSWLHTFLVKGRGFTEGALLLSSAPYVLAILANLAGGVVSDGLCRRWGPRTGRRAVGAGSLAAASACAAAAYVSRDPWWTLAWLSLCYGAITFQQPGVFGVCLDIGRHRAGAMVGLMNTASQAGGFIGSVADGYIVGLTGSYDAPFVPMAAVLAAGALLWARVDASRPLPG